MSAPASTSKLLKWAGAQHTLPANVRKDVIRLLGDTLAIGAAAVGAPGEPAILQTARSFGQGEEVRLIGTSERLPAASAAFVNGYRIHCLEWDGVHEPAVVHAMSVVIAALGAVLDRRAAKGDPCEPEEALVALAIGVDVASGLGIAASSGLAFFRPATAGIFGATIAAARIDKAPLADALGIAYSSASGTMQPHVEGLATLPFQIANAARAAVTACDLARAGFAGSKDPFEGEFGYFTLFDEGDLSIYTDTIGSVWRISEVSTKPFPSGRASHAALGKLQELALDPALVSKIELACPPLVRRLVERVYSDTMTPAYARLCLPWLAALMLADGRIDPRSFTAEHFADSALAQVAAKVDLVPDGNTDPNALFPQELRVTMIDGTSYTYPIAATLGSQENPLSAEQIKAKLGLARDLAPPDADARIFLDPLAYFLDIQ